MKNRQQNVYLHLEGQQGLVYLGALHPGLPVGGVRVRSPLVARQVDQGELAVQRPFPCVCSQDDLEDCMTS